MQWNPRDSTHVQNNDASHRFYSSRIVQVQDEIPDLVLYLYTCTILDSRFSTANTVPLCDPVAVGASWAKSLDIGRSPSPAGYSHKSLR